MNVAVFHTFCVKDLDQHFNTLTYTSSVRDKSHLFSSYPQWFSKKKACKDHFWPIYQKQKWWKAILIKISLVISKTASSVLEICQAIACQELLNSSFVKGNGTSFSFFYIRSSALWSLVMVHISFEKQCLMFNRVARTSLSLSTFLYLVISSALRSFLPSRTATLDILKGNMQTKKNPKVFISIIFDNLDFEFLVCLINKSFSTERVFC